MIFLILLAEWLTLCQQIVLSATCNLLESDKTAYKDYSTFSAIADLCNGDSGNFSLWETYQCDYIKGRNETCWPKRYFSSCSPGNLRGIAFFYHGYTACSDQYKPIVSLLQSACYHVYLPCTVGHGLDYCNGNSSECTNGGYNLTELPTKREGYIEFIDYMNQVMTDEVSIVKECELNANSEWNNNNNEFDTLLGGLSLGASLSATTALRSYLYDIEWTKQVLMSPFLGVSYSGADDIIYKCALNNDEFRSCLPYYFEAIGFDFSFANGTSSVLVNLTYDLIASYVDTEFIDSSYETLNLLIRDVLTYAVETNDSSVTDNSYIQSLLETQIGWGDKCQSDQANYGRGGFCNFLVRHILAAHSLGSYVVDNVDNSEDWGTVVDTQFIMVERDGATRNSLVAYYAQLMYSNNETTISSKSNGCMWLISEECQSDDDREIDNTCGVPHSSMSIADNIGSDPYYLWWNETYNNGIIAFATDGTYPDLFNDKSSWTGDKTQCLWIDMYDPPDYLVADVPQKFEIILNLVSDTISTSIENSILDTISSITGVPRGILELSVKIIENIDLSDYIDDSDGSSGSSSDNYVHIETSLTEDAAEIMEALLEYEAIDEIEGYQIEYSTVSGNSYDVENQDESDSDTGIKIGSNAAILAMSSFIFVYLW